MAGKKRNDSMVKVEENQALATHDYGDDAGSGFEDQTVDDITIPFLAVLQGLSPQVTNNSPDGSRPGMLYNTVTEELVSGDDGIFVIPARIERLFVEWKAREDGGGQVARYAPDDPVVKRAQASCEFGKLKTEAGNDLLDTYYLYCVQLETGKPVDEAEPIGFVVLSFVKTKIKVFKHWNTRVNMFTIPVNGGKQRPPIFAHTVKVTSAKQKNNKGTFYNFALNPASGDMRTSLLAPDDPRLHAAKDCAEMVKKGLAKASVEGENKAVASEADEEAPF